MKIMILGDIHFGIKNNNQYYLDYQLDYFKNQLFPLLEKHDIKYIFQLGDFFHSRKTIDVNTLHRIKTEFLEYLKRKNIKLHVLVGNHDAYYTKSNEVTSLSVLKEYSNIEIIEQPKLFTIDKFEFSMIPWIANNDDLLQFEKFKNENPHKITMGHYGINDFEVIPGITMRDGLSKEMFDTFNKVYSGHFHIRQVSDTFTYVGTPYEMDWGDYGSIKGCTIIETVSCEEMFIENTDKKYVKIYYNEDEEIDLPEIENKIVKVYIEKNEDLKKYHKFIEKIENNKPFELSIVNKIDTSEEEFVIDTENKTLIDIINEYIDEDEIQEKDEIRKIMNMIYEKTLVGE